MNRSPSRNSFFYGRTLLISFCSLASLAAGIGYSIFHSTPEDFASYHELMAEANPTLADKTQKAPYKASQQQEHVRKDFFALKEKKRLHVLLNSQDVNLVIDHHHGNTELTEELSGVRWYVQEDLFFTDPLGNRLPELAVNGSPKQKIYHGNAEKAFFSYQDKTFTAEKIQACSIEIPGHEIDEKLLDSLSVDSEISLKANRAFYDGKDLLLSGEIYVKNSLGSLSAQKATAISAFKNKKSPFETVLLEESVSVHLMNEWTVQSDRAIYEKCNPGSSLELVTFDSAIPFNRAIVTHKSGDRLSGSLIVFDVKHQQVYVKEPKGVFKASFSGSAKTENVPLEIQSSVFLWDITQNSIALKGAIELKYGNIGFLKNNQEMKLYYADNDGKKELHSIEGEGHTVLCHYEDTPQCSHWVICDGKIYVNHAEKTITLNSSQGTTCSDKQVFFYDALGEVQADKITIIYNNKEGKLVATKVFLEGNVYLIDHKILDGAGQKPKMPLHYALADFVEYDPLTKEMYFTSKKGNRVLFEDKINHLQVSAPALRITRNSQTKKDAIQGVGDVRFHFIENELNQLRKLTGIKSLSSQS